MDPLKAAVVSRHPLVLLGLRALLDERPDAVSLVAVAEHDGHLAGLDVVVYDLAGLDGSDGEDLRHLVRGRSAVVGVERDGRSDLADRARTLGVTRTFALDVTADELVRSLRAAAAGPDVPPPASAAPRVLGPLSERETQIMALVAAGKTNAQIGEEVYLGLNTVKTHLRNAYRKIGVRSRSQAVLWYLRETRGASLFR